MPSQVSYTIKVITVGWSYPGPVGLNQPAPTQLPLIVETLTYANCAKPAVTPTQPPILVIDDIKGVRKALIPITSNIRIECEGQEVPELLKPTMLESQMVH
jgi:hypothetical protein